MRNDEGKYVINRTGKKVVADFRRLLTSGDWDKFTPGLYHALIQHGGFIAHFSQHGFASHYTGRMTELLDGEFYPLYDEWRWENSAHHLEDSVYKDGMSAGDVMRGICAVANELKDEVMAREQNQRREAHVALMEAIADEYGYEVTPK
jgi:hypothetical protein